MFRRGERERRKAEREEERRLRREEERSRRKAEAAAAAAAAAEAERVQREQQRLAELALMQQNNFDSMMVRNVTQLKRKKGVVNQESLFFLTTLVFQLEEVCGINVVAHKMKNVSGGI